jgi:hypothetical protein
MYKLIALFLMLFSFSVSAKYVEAEGVAEIQFDDIASAKVKAYRDAVRNASLQASVKISSSQVLEDGNLTVDYIRMNSAAQVDNVSIESEYRDGALYKVRIRADVSQDRICSTHVVNDFRKTVAVMGFPLLDAEQTSIGALGNIARSLSSEITHQLNNLTATQGINASYMTLYAYPEHAPTNWNTRQQLTRAVDAAKSLGTQFVLSGVIRSVAMSGEISERPLWSNSFLPGQGNNRDRDFEIDLYLHDGFSGALVFQSRYKTSGKWDLPRNSQAPFGRQSFNQTDYGKSVQRLIHRAVADVEQTISCQPFISKITQVDKKRVYINAGADSGLRPNDAISVYRTSEFFDRAQNSQIKITDTGLVAIIKQVQPNFAIAELPVRVEQLNLQPDDLIMAW